MKYACLIYSDENQNVRPDSPDFAEVMVAYTKFNDDSTAAGVSLGGEALEPTSTATSVRVRDGEVITTDGPFAETKEHLGGFYLLECENLDQALDWAARIPGARYGTIEVRPVSSFG